MNANSDSENILMYLYPTLSRPKTSRFMNFFKQVLSNNKKQANSIIPRKNTKKSHTTIKPENICSGNDTRTSIIIKNLPSIYSKEQISKWISSICKTDYLYIPINIDSNKILGFAFVNVINSKDILTLFDFLNEQIDKTNPSISKKIEICYSKMQGINSLIKAFGKDFIMRI